MISPAIDDDEVISPSLWGLIYAAVEFNKFSGKKRRCGVFNKSTERIETVHDSVLFLPSFLPPYMRLLACFGWISYDLTEISQLERAFLDMDFSLFQRQLIHLVM